MPSNSSANQINLQSLDKTFNSAYIPTSSISTLPLDLAPYTASSSSLLFIDASVSHIESLVAGVAPGTEVYILNPAQDAITQITNTLLGRQGISSLQIISHGNVASLDFASSSLNISNVRTYTNDLQAWGKALTADADILLYGCNVAAGETGATFIQQLSQLTGADVAASDDLTGNDSKAGNWVLESTTGLIESSKALQLDAMAGYDSVFNSPVAIINEFSQGSTGAKEWVEILVVQDNVNLQNYRLVDGSTSNGLNIQLSGADFNGLKAGTLIVLYNAGDVDSVITPDLSYDPAKGDYSLQISSLNSTSNFAVTRNNGWSSTTAAFDNSSSTDVPRLLDAAGVEIYKFPKSQTPAGFQVVSLSPFRALPGRATAFLGNTAAGAILPANWSDDYYSAAGNPGLANGGINTAWINSLRGNVSPSFNNSTDLTLSSINEDTPLTNNKGVLISDLIKGQVSDINNNIQGIAVTDVIGSGNWQYSLNGGDNWSPFGKVSDTSAAVLAGLVSLYSGAASTAPQNQGWLQYGASPPISQAGMAVGGTQTVNAGATNLVSTESGSAGYSNYSGGFTSLLNPAFPTLDRNQGFTLSFDVKITSETHSDNTRAGFNVILVTSDKTKAIELGFWQDRIFAQNTTFTASTESVARSTAALTRYDLKVQGDTYQLFAAGETTAILTGLLRNYTAFDHTTSGPFSTPLPYDPYERENFIFLGDNTSRASANIDLARVELINNTKIRFAPSANYNGDATIKFRAWDGTDGATTGSSGVSTTSNAFSATSKMANLTVNSIPEWQIVAVDNFTSLNKQSILQRNETGAYRIVSLNSDNIPEITTLPTVNLSWEVAGIADFTGDKIKDILVRNSTTTENQIWYKGTNSTVTVTLPTTNGNITIQHIGDFEGDGDSDILLRDSSNGEIKVWETNVANPNFIREVILGTVPDNNTQIKQLSDLDGDGDLDIFWYNAVSGAVAIWEMNGTAFSQGVGLPTVSDTNTKIQLVADFDGDKDMDILWYNNTTGLTALWDMNGINLNQGVVLGYVSDTKTKIKHIGNFDGDNDLDILWYNETTGYTAIWEMDGVNLKKGISLADSGNANTLIERVADADGDRDLDIFWYNAVTGYTAVWEMNGVNLQQGINLGYVSDTNTKIKSIANFDGDNDLDVFWHNETSGFTAMWTMNGASLQQGFALPKIDTGFKVNVVGDLNGDGKLDVVWHNSTTNVAKVWLTNGASILDDILLPF
ncbi:MAG: DUF4347 domain-containing protein [Calothrix sp. FI2-JRJ7]|jgi:hypothetical protein|nr:DUF4347 domain-containing protein [Calothrix sp. FI2-JRJ7]